MKNFLPIMLVIAVASMSASRADSVYLADEHGAVTVLQEGWLGSSRALPGDLDHAFLATSLSAVLPDLGTIEKVILDGVVSSLTNNVLQLRNLRVLSSTTTLDDYISLDLLLDVGALQLLPLSANIIENLGIYAQNDRLFSRDVPSDIYLITPEGHRLGPDREHRITASSEDEFTMFLEAGTVLAFRVNASSDDFVLTATAPDGSRWMTSQLYRRGSSWVSWDRPTIILPGLYTFRFTPQNHETLSLDFGFTNQNRTMLTEIVSGSRISGSLRSWGKQYAKYQIYLRAGDLLSLTKSSESTRNYLVDFNNRRLINSSGEINYIAGASGYYYLFIVKDDPWNNISYSATVSVTPDPDFPHYPVIANIANQTATLGTTYHFSLAATNAPTEFSAAGLPPGLSVDRATGVISGTPSLMGTFAVSAFANNEFGGDRQDFLLTVRPMNDNGVTLITHYYTSILQREPDTAGLAHWQRLVADQQAQGLDVKPVFQDMAYRFFNSPEYLDRNTSNEEFVINLYLTFFQRSPDNAGLAFWLNQLKEGTTRNSALHSFVHSPEFTAFMQQLGF